MISLLRIDFKNCINNIKFKACFLVMCGISIFSYICIVLGCINKNSLDLLSTNNLSLITGIGTKSMYYIILFSLPIIASFIYSDSFVYEKENNICLYYFLRKDKRKYYVSKVIVNFVVVFLTIFISLSINEILTFIAVPNIGIQGTSATPVYQNIINEDTIHKFWPSLYIAHPFIYNYFIIFLNAMFGALISVIAFNISLIFNMKKITVVVIAFLGVNISVFILPIKYQFQMYVQTWKGEMNDFIFTLLGWIAVGVITLLIGMWRQLKIDE